MATIKYADKSPYSQARQVHHPSDYKYTKFQQSAGLVPRDTKVATPDLRILNVAIFGLGRAGSIHQVNTMRNPRLKLKYIIEENPARLKAVQQEWNLPDESLINASQTDDILADPSLHGVIICTPTYTHEGLIKKALSAKKAVFCEKPIGENEEETRRCYNMAEETGLPLLCAFNRRFDPSFRQLQARVRSGEIGQVHCIKTVARDCPLPSIDYLKISGGIFHDCLVHDIDLICWVLGEYPAEVFAAAHSFIPEIKAINDHDTVMAVMKFPSGTIGSIDVSRCAVYGYDQRLEAFGPKGMISAKNESPCPLVLEVPEGLQKIPMYHSFPSRYQQAYVDELEHFCDILQGISENSLSGENTLRVSKIASTLEKSVKTGSFIKVEY